MIDSWTAKNLFSWEYLHYKVPRGISQVIGWNHDDGNREGAGKSSLFNIVSWTLWGKIPKEALIDECVREGQKEAEGRVKLASGWVVVRRRGKGQGLYIVSPSGIEKKATQDEVDDLVGSMSLFCQTIYFPQNYTKGFVVSDEETKSKILTESRDIRIYDLARKDADDQLKETRDKLEAARVYLKDAEEKLTIGLAETAWVVEQLGEFEARKAERVGQINSAIDKAQSLSLRIDEELLEAEVTDFKGKQAEARKEVTDRTAQSRSAKLVVDANTRLKGDLRVLAAAKAKLEQDLTKSSSNLCPTCGQETEKDKLHAHFESKRKELAAAEQSIALKSSQVMPETPDIIALVGAANEAECAVTAALSVAERALQVAKAKNAAADAHRSQVESLRKERRAEKEKKPDALMDKLSECQARDGRLSDALGNRRAEVSSLAELVERLDTVRGDFRQIKSDIFQTALQELTRDTNTFLRVLFDVPVRVRFENQVERGVSKIKTYVTIEGKERSLGLYSGGQLRRVSIAVDLALSKMVASRTGRGGGLRILDEPLKDLSPQSKERFMALLSQLPGSTILIEHDPVVQAMVGHTFAVEFKNGVSKETGA